MAGTRDEWETFVSRAMEDGEGPRFDALTGILEQVTASDGESPDSTTSLRLLEALKAGSATVDELVNFLLSAGVDVPGRPAPPPTRSEPLPTDRRSPILYKRLESTGSKPLKVKPPGGEEIRGGDDIRGGREPGPI